ncbi:hypothetical protein [Microbacterium sp. PMB16]|uniref:hypothetical protein n=1 Tax=Microbacterium sp. PMB16 TaxID=3120157 RepID=UPI003F4B3482
MFSASLLYLILIYAAASLIGLLVLWFVIYTAVRAALTTHRQALAQERREGGR